VHGVYAWCTCWGMLGCVWWCVEVCWGVLRRVHDLKCFAVYGVCGGVRVVYVLGYIRCVWWCVGVCWRVFRIWGVLQCMECARGVCVGVC